LKKNIQHCRVPAPGGTRFLAGSLRRGILIEGGCAPGTPRPGTPNPDPQNSHSFLPTWGIQGKISYAFLTVPYCPVSWKWLFDVKYQKNGVSCREHSCIFAKLSCIFRKNGETGPVTGPDGWDLRVDTLADGDSKKDTSWSFPACPPSPNFRRANFSHRDFPEIDPTRGRPVRGGDSNRSMKILLRISHRKIPATRKKECYPAGCNPVACRFRYYADSTRTDVREADGTRSDTRRISTPTRLFLSS
jgi:hypothetical protein